MFTRDSETTGLGGGPRSIDPVVHSLEAGDPKMVVLGDGRPRPGIGRVDSPRCPDHACLRLCFVSATTSRDHTVLISNPTVTDGDIDAGFVDDGRSPNVRITIARPSST